jgi:hypothetical protein
MLANWQLQKQKRKNATVLFSVPGNSGLGCSLLKVKKTQHFSNFEKLVIKDIKTFLW